DTLLVLFGTAGVTVAMFGRFIAKPVLDIPVRCVLALPSFVVMMHPSQTVSMAAAAVVIPFALFGIWRHQRIAPPKTLAPQEPAAAAPAGDLSKLVAEATREI